MSIINALGPIGAGLGILEGGAQFIDSLGKEKKDKKDLENLKQPFYKIQDEVFQNKNITEQMASGGLPAATKDYMTSEAERGLGSSLDAILRTGGGVNDASVLLDQYNQQIGKIGAEDASQHLNNIQYFMKANADLAGEKTKQWSINEYQPYEAKLKELKQNIATDQANKWGGVNTAVSSFVGGATGLSNADLMKKLFGQGGKVTDPYASGTSFAPMASLPGVQSTGGFQSPAAGVTSINPNSASGGISFSDVSDNS